MISKSLKAAILCSIVVFTSCKDDKNSDASNMNSLQDHLQPMVEQQLVFRGGHCAVGNLKLIIIPNKLPKTQI